MDSHDAAPEPTAHDERPAPAVVAEEQRLERRVVAYWYATDLVRALAMAAMLIVVDRSLRAEVGLPAWSEQVAWGLAIAVVVTALVAPAWTYATWRFSVDDRLLSMRFGMLFVEDRRVPVPRMQHVDISRGPIERLFGLATFVVFTAGNEGSAFRLPGLSQARAEALRDGILRARGRDVV
jgi:membrane protein YdbS with pleckstrin-like domain